MKGSVVKGKNKKSGNRDCENHGFCGGHIWLTFGRHKYFYGIIDAMENKRRIPYGVINWAEIVRECFFVDN